MRIAIPCEGSGGLGDAVSPHFGHCRVFTLVDVDGESAEVVRVLPNEARERGDCMVPVMLLKDAGVNVLVAGGMGRRRQMAFNQVGISVCFSESAARASDAAERVTTGRARTFGPDHVCQGHARGGCR